VGHVFQGRFKGILVERESHLLELARYVVLNPVRAGMVRSAEAYRWSSLRATLGLSPSPPWLTTRSLLAAFGSAARFLDFVREGIEAESPWRTLRGGLLGSDAFVEEMGVQLDEYAERREIPRRQRYAHRQSLEQILPAHIVANRPLRNERIRTACRDQGYTYSEVGRHLALHCGTVSRIVGAG
jgi:hypothetical protein